MPTSATPPPELPQELFDALFAFHQRTAENVAVAFRIRGYNVDDLKSEAYVLLTETLRKLSSPAFIAQSVRNGLCRKYNNRSDEFDDLSLDFEYKDETGPFTLHDVVADPTPDACTQLIEGEEPAALRAAVQAMPEIDRAILTHTYGIGDAEVLTTRELGEKVGLGKSAVAARITKLTEQLKAELVGAL